jgi:rhodanese-related sulfurtransferase
MIDVPAATPAEVDARRKRGDSLQLIDVREFEEVAIAAIEGALVRPMSEGERWIDTLPREGDLVIFCHHGIRSLHVARVLMERGHRNVINMSGGIDQWSTDVDRDVPRY